MSKEIRCPKCRKKLCEVSGVAIVNAKCPRCKAEYLVQVLDGKNIKGRNGTL